MYSKYVFIFTQIMWINGLLKGNVDLNLFIIKYGFHWSSKRKLKYCVNNYVTVNSLVLIAMEEFYLATLCWK